MNNWQPTNGQNYNYCNMNTVPTQNTGYGQQARNVFQDQVQPIVTQVGEPYSRGNEPVSVTATTGIDTTARHATVHTPATATVQPSTDTAVL